MIRSKAYSKASSIRKNEFRRLTKRKKLGQKIDDIVAKNNVEYGIDEAAKGWIDKNDKKYLKTSLKMSKVLKDIFLELSLKIDNKVNIVNKLQVHGNLHLGKVIKITVFIVIMYSFYLVKILIITISRTISANGTHVFPLWLCDDHEKRENY